MTSDIKRATEIYLAGKLGFRVPGHSFLPFNGNDSTTPAEPPFTIIAMGDAERMLPMESTWLIKGTVQVITHYAEASAGMHSALVRAIYAALCRLAPDSSNPTFSFHGLDVAGQRNNSDEALQVHADIFDVTVGVGG